MLTEEQVARFLADGFVHGGTILDDGEVEVLRDEMERVINQRDRDDVPQPVRIVNLHEDDQQPVWQIVNIWQASEPFSRLTRNPQIAEEIAQLTGADELRIFCDQVQYKPAEHGGVNHWHQDAPLWPILRPMTQVSAWVALDDVDESNGCMSMVPGSHKWGDQIQFLLSQEGVDLPKEFEGRTVARLLRPVRKGEVHYHHALTWHCSHENTSPRPRRAIAIHVLPDETRYVASADHPMKPYIGVEDGGKIEGEAFPLIYRRSGS
jgi:phytanoyl-CoA hydroxylase